MFCIWPGVPYEFWECPDDPWQFHWTMLTGPGKEDVIGDWGFAPTRPVRRPVSPDKAAHIFREMLDYWGFGAGRLIHRALALFFELIAISGPELPGHSVSPTAELVRQIGRAHV